VNVEQPPTFFNENEVRDRVERFLVGPYNMHHAADCGLLALAVEARFGGFLIDMNMRIRTLYLRQYPGKWHKLSPIWVHNRVCDVIYKHGTVAQYDWFLPRLAAGKSFGAWTYLRGDSHIHSSVRADTCEDGFRLWGNTVINAQFNQQTLVLIAALFEGQVREFIVNGATMSEYHVSKRGRVLVQLRDYIAPQRALLGTLERSEPPTNEK